MTIRVQPIGRMMVPRLKHAMPRTQLAARLTAVALDARSTPKMRAILQCVHGQIVRQRRAAAAEAEAQLFLREATR